MTLALAVVPLAAGGLAFTSLHPWQRVRVGDRTTVTRDASDGVMPPPRAALGRRFPEEPMSSTMTPTIRELGPDEARAILRTHDVGRIAYASHGQVDIEPIHYVYDHEEDALYARTSPGAKLLTLRHNPWVAFEVDEVHGRHAWRSVVVHGTVYELRAGGTPADRVVHARALELLRAREPAALTPDDPAPARTLLFRVTIDQLYGREAVPEPPDALHAAGARSDALGRWRSP